MTMDLLSPTEKVEPMRRAGKREPVGRRIRWSKHVKTTFSRLQTPFTRYWIHTEVHELHPTKGWRYIGEEHKEITQREWDRLPPTQEQFTRTRPPRYELGIQPMPITERMLLRHGWYRRQLRQQGIAIDPNAKNAIAIGRDVWRKPALPPGVTIIEPEKV